MPYIYYYLGFLLAFGFLIAILGAKTSMLRVDLKTSDVVVPQRIKFSWAKVQLAWWSWIILSSFAGISLSYLQIPDIEVSTLILLGLSAMTLTVSRSIDIADESTSRLVPFTNFTKPNGLFLDIISDQTGVSLARLQNVLFNLIFGLWYLGVVFGNLKHFQGGAENAVLPHISMDDLILLGLSSATYAALKATENKSKLVKLIRDFNDSSPGGAATSNPNFSHPLDEKKKESS